MFASHGSHSLKAAWSSRIRAPTPQAKPLRILRTRGVPLGAVYNQPDGLTVACTIQSAENSGSAPCVAVDGDLVTLHYDCKDSNGQMIDSSRERDEPITLEVGVGEVLGNPLAQALEQAVRSHGEGDIVELEITGGDYDKDLLFKVPIDHQEVQRLQGRYKSCAPLWWKRNEQQGGLQVDKIVELQNGGLAKVISIDDANVVLDANNMLAGVERTITVELLKIERPSTS